MRVVVAMNSSAGMAAMTEAETRGETFDVILVDSRMPGMQGFEFLRQAGVYGFHAHAARIMLLSVGQALDSARCRQLGPHSHVSKPIDETELIEAMVAAVEGRRESTAPPSPEPVTERIEPRRVLLAEDNAVNQRVGAKILESLGHRVVIASNGKEALDHLEGETFDLVLMDVQMPEMDGFTATRAIRAAEQDTGRHIPVFAMTAHAMKGDRELCLAAGMDGYITKPVSRQDIADAIAGISPFSGERSPDGSERVAARSARCERTVENRCRVHRTESSERASPLAAQPALT